MTLFPHLSHTYHTSHMILSELLKVKMPGSIYIVQLVHTFVSLPPIDTHKTSKLQLHHTF